MDAEAAIKEAFCKLLENEDYNRITVAEICRTAHVSSKTFYKYFEGKPGLVHALMYDDWAAPILKVREVLPLEKIESSTTLMIAQSFEQVWSKRALYRNLFKNYGRTELADDITEALSELNRTIYSTYGLEDEELDVVVRLFSTMQIPLVHWWLTERDDIPPQRMARYYEDWCFGHWQDLDTSRKR